MKIDLKKGIVTIYEAKCRLCGQKMQSPDEGGCHKLLIDHVDNECKVVKAMKDWDRQGFYKEMMGFLQDEVMARDVKKLVKRYGLENIKEFLEGME